MTSRSHPSHYAREPQRSLGSERIFPLNQDLMWNILSINAEMDHESENDLPALTTLRRAAQVSSSWRKLVLSATSLWGKVINFDHLNQRTGHWRDEVLRRSGQSLLDVKGRTGRQEQSADFFVSLLTSHWDRIRSLDLNTGGEIRYIGDEVILGLFQRPAPFLETFNVPTFHRLDDPLVIGNDFRFFSDKAPSLRHFKTFSKEVPFHITAPWLFQLRSFTLIHPVTGYQLVQAFASMPLLESFIGKTQLIADPDPNSLNSFPVATLSRLNRIIINTAMDSKQWINILSKLTPAPDCFLTFELILLHVSLTAIDMSAACRLLASYSQRYFNTHRIFSVRLRIAERVFYLIDGDGTHPSPETFSFQLQSWVPLPTVTSSTVFESLSSCRWNSATEKLNLSVDIPNSLDSNTDSGFLQFISSFTSLHSLALTFGTLRLLVGLPTDTARTLLPSLREVQYLTRGQDERHVSDMLFPFLASRRAIGRSIEVLELIRPDSRTEYHDFTFLDALT